MSDFKIEVKPLEDGNRQDDHWLTVTTTMRNSEFERFHAAMQSDDWEKRQALRNADLQTCLKSIQVAMNWAMHHDCSGAAVFARLLASLYNGDRVKMDASRLVFVLDGPNLEHALNVIRLCYETRREPHTFFVDGGDLFERMIATWGFEKRRRKAA
jgi:hypothetical protein